MVDAHFTMVNNVNYYILFPAIEQTFLPMVHFTGDVQRYSFGAAYLSYPNREGAMLDSRWTMCYTVAWARKGAAKKC